MKLTQLIFAASICLLNTAMAAEFRLNATGSEPLYQTTLAKAVYQYSRNDNLQDLTINNAAGEPVPYALLPHHELHQQTANILDAKPLNFFPLKDSNLRNPSDLTVQIDKIANSTSVNITTKSFDITPNDNSIGGQSIYLVDAGEKHPPLQTLSLHWQGNENMLLTVEVLASDDLKHWTNVGYGVLLNTSLDGKALRQDSIHLDNATKARYLQLRGADNATFYISKINAEYHNLQVLTPALLWQEVPLQQREQADENGVVNIDYESQGRYPASYLRVQLPQNNTITSTTIFVRNRSDADWQYLTSASLYRTDKAGKNYSNPDIFLNATTSRFWRLKFNQSSGGIGAENPSLSLGWLPHTVVWNARGQAPFSLHVGENPNIVNTVDIASLIPNFKFKKLQDIASASLKIELSTTTEAVINTWKAPIDYKRWLLWGGLLLGVLLLAGMAFSLLKTERKE
ncbi:MAG: DUF3999 domain-containing protein [Methylotenera sp.]|nr:DUF3999 domain-containing protein [Methylotenera sp.]